MTIYFFPVSWCSVTTATIIPRDALTHINAAAMRALKPV